VSASSLEPLVSELRKLIIDGDIEDVFERLLNYLPTNAPKLYNEVLAQSARFQALRRRQLAGVVTIEQSSVEENNISSWLINFIGKLALRVKPQFSPVPPAVNSATEGDLPKIKQEEITTEKILGINNLKQISWIERGVQVCKSVCRVLTPNGIGTGFLVGRGMIMTNNHVIGSRESAAASVIEFDYQQDGAGQLLPTFRYQLDPDRFHTNEKLDYTLVGLKEDSGKRPLESWGRLQLNPNADPIPTEHVSIVQHPNGGLKQIVLTANWVVAAKPPYLHYTTDTMPGSSGSPVFNDTWHVIAIHHAAVLVQDAKQGYANEGILMSAIKADAGEFWPDGNL
jgi:V8-like Glu-specific endopeptidase